MHRDHTAAEVLDEGQNSKPRKAKKRHRRDYEQGDSDAEAIQDQQVSEAMADAFAQRAPSEGAATLQDGADQAKANPEVGVSGTEAIEAEAGQMFRQALPCILLPTFTMCKVSCVMSSQNWCSLEGTVELASAMQTGYRNRVCPLCQLFLKHTWGTLACSICIATTEPLQAGTPAQFHAW